ncbi:hypothetical protein J2W33_004500 [Variovorax boronicumulans]|nr:hypothetical protein [Variovorax boronicumulans]
MSTMSFSLSPWGEGGGECMGLHTRAASAIAAGPHPSPLPKGRGSNSRNASDYPKTEAIP